jgi:hypothetical protein
MGSAGASAGHETLTSFHRWLLLPLFVSVTVPTVVSSIVAVMVLSWKIRAGLCQVPVPGCGEHSEPALVRLQRPAPLVHHRDHAVHLALLSGKSHSA